VAQIKGQENGERDVCRQEIRYVPVGREKDLETVCKGQKRDYEESPPDKVRLETGLVWKSMQKTVILERLPETDICYHTHDPGNEPGDRSNIGEPGKDLGTGVGYVEEGQQTDGPSGQDCNIWNAFPVRLAEDGWCLAV